MALTPAPIDSAPEPYMPTKTWLYTKVLFATALVPPPIDTDPASKPVLL